MSNFSTFTAASSSGFLNTIGIDASVGDQQNGQIVASQLSYLGVNHYRANVWSTDGLLAASDHGAKADLIVPWFMYPINTNTLKLFLTNQVDPAAKVVEAVEGPNELNTDPDTYNGVGGPQGFMALQTDLYHLVHSDPKLVNTSVFDFSVLQGTSSTTYSGMQNSADYNNVHAYGGAGIPPIWIFPYEVAHNQIAGNKPTIITETGATTIHTDTTVGVDQAGQARFDIDALLDSYQLGVKTTYLYNLQDWNDSSNTDNFSAYYGLYDINGNIKLAGTALHNFTTILGSNPSSTSSQASLNIQGLSYNDNSQVFANSNGESVVLWNESQNWSFPSHQVTLTLPTNASSINIFDPLLSASPIQTIHNTSSVTVTLGSDPLIVQILPATSTVTLPPATAADTLLVSDAMGHHLQMGTQSSSSATFQTAQTGLDQTITQSIGANGVDTISTPVWNDVRTLNIHNTQGHSYATNAFLEVDASLSGAQNGSLLITSAKRGVISLDGGNYQVTINALSNAPDPTNASGEVQHLNDFKITAGSGNDIVTVNGQAGMSNITFTSGSGHNVFKGSGASDLIIFGSGRTEATGSVGGVNNYVYHSNSGVDIIENFGAGHDTLNIDQALKSSMKISHGTEGTTLMFGSSQHELVLHAVQNFDLGLIHWN